MKLNTTEKFLLIAQHPAKGKFMISDIHINYGIIGSLLLEMSLENKIRIENDRLIMENRGRTDDPVLSEISMLIQSAAKPGKVRYWVTKLARRSRKYKWAILNAMASKRLVRIEHRKFLGLIPYKRSYLIESKLRNDLIRQLRDGILFRRELGNQNVVILGLIEACKMHKIITSDRTELKRLKKELKEVIKDSPIAGTVDKTIQQVQAAILTTIIASTTVTTATSSS